MAEYRAGRFADAIATLTQADKLYRLARGTSHPTHTAFLALAHRALGRAGDARDFQVRMKDLLRSEWWRRNEDAQTIRREVDQQLGDPTEASAAAREQEAIKEAVFAAEEGGWFRHDLAAYLKKRKML